MHPLDGRSSLQAGQEVAAGDAAGQVVRAVRTDDGHPRPGLGDEAVDHGDTLGVGPVQVLEDQHGSSLTDPLADLLRRLDDRVRPADRLVQEAAHEAEGTGHPTRVTVAGEHQRGARQTGDQLAQQAGLADAGFTGDQRHRRQLRGRDGRRVDEVAQLRQRRGPADHERAEAGAPFEHAGHGSDALPTARRSDQNVDERLGGVNTGHGAGLLTGRCGQEASRNGSAIVASGDRGRPGNGSTAARRW